MPLITCTSTATHMLCDNRQSLLNNLGVHHKIQNMTAKYGNHDTKDFLVTKGSASLDCAPPGHTMPRRDNESSDKYSEEPNIYHPLDKLQKQFWKLQEQLTHLEPATHPHTYMAKLMQLTDKLHHLTMTVLPHQTPSLERNQYTHLLQSCTDTLCATQGEANLTTPLLQDIPTFDGQDSSKLEDCH